MINSISFPIVNVDTSVSEMTLSNSSTVNIIILDLLMLNLKPDKKASIWGFTLSIKI